MKSMSASTARHEFSGRERPSVEGRCGFGVSTGLSLDRGMWRCTRCSHAILVSTALFANGECDAPVSAMRAACPEENACHARMQNLPGQHYFPAAGTVFAGSTRVKERFSLKSQNQPR